MLVFVAAISVKAMLLVIDCKYALTEKTEIPKSRKKISEGKGLYCDRCYYNVVYTVDCYFFYSLSDSCFFLY